MNTDTQASTLRKIAWDLLPCQLAEQYMPILNLVPASDQGAEVEHAASHKRMELQEPLQRVLPAYSAMASRVLAGHALRLHDGPEPEAVVGVVTGQFQQTIHAGASAIIANLLDQGYLQLGPKLSDEAARV
jgi:hypothetical protein